MARILQVFTPVKLAGFLCHVGRNQLTAAWLILKLPALPFWAFPLVEIGWPPAVGFIGQIFPAAGHGFYCQRNRKKALT